MYDSNVFLNIFVVIIPQKVEKSLKEAKNKKKQEKYLRGNIPRCPAPIPFVHISFNRGPRVDKKPKRISADSFSFGSYSHFTGILAYSMVYTNKSNDGISS